MVTSRIQKYGKKAVDSQTIGAVRDYRPNVASTNTLAKQMLGEWAHGHVLYTFDQTAGRGQHENSWWCNPGHSLCVSIVLRPAFLTPRQLFALNMMSALAVAQLCANQCVASTVQVKWPNDVLIDGQKVAGILTETSISGGEITAVLGIGLNVSGSEIPVELAGKATTLALKGGSITPEAALDTLCQHLNFYYNLLAEKSPQALLQPYKDRLYRYKEQALYRSDGETFAGQIIGVGPDGELRVSTESGVRSFVAKEIEYL